MSLNIERIEHIGIAVKSLETSIPLFEKLLGVPCFKVEEIVDQLVKTAFFKIGDVKIELLESISEEGPISKFIQKNGEGLHHLAFKVESANNALLQAKDLGFRLIDYTSRKGADSLNIGFLNPKSTNNILIEFCSDEK